MNDPVTASLGARNIGAKLAPSNRDYSVNGRNGARALSGREWWSEGAIGTECEVGIALEKMGSNSSNNDADDIRPLAIMAVPMPGKGASIPRPLAAFGEHGAPRGRAEARLRNVIMSNSGGIALGARK